MRVRLEPVDEYMHEVGPEANFNESMYFNVVDHHTGVAGFFRIGNRPNEGTAEMTCCLWLPEGAGPRVGFAFARPAIEGNERFDAGGMAFTVHEPFERLGVRYDGKVVMLEDPTALEDPRAAFTEHPWVDSAVDLEYRGQSAMYGGEPEEPSERPGEEFARGHYEQLVGATGTVRIGEREWAVDGVGLRDHSWGPRYWQAPWYYRWLTANGDGFGFMGSRIARRDGDGTRGGFVWDDGQLHLCDTFRISTDWDAARPYQSTVRASLHAGDRTWEVTGEVLSVVPLRNRRTAPDGEPLVTRIAEGLTRWTMADGRVAYGLSEYLDQVVDGRPVGIEE